MRILVLACGFLAFVGTAEAGTRCQQIGNQIFCSTTGGGQAPTQTRCQIIGNQMFCT